MPQVPALSIVFMFVSALLSIGLPVFLLVFFRRKYRAPLLPALFGAAAFVIAVLVFESLIHSVVFANTPIRDSPYVYIVYGILMAGIFEETARFLVFSLLKKRQNTVERSVASGGVEQGGVELTSTQQSSTEQGGIARRNVKRRDVGTGLSYGVGHGGIEAIILVGITMVSNIVLCLLINAGMWGSVTGSLDAATADTLNSQIAVLWETTPALFLLGGVERVFAIGIQIALSVIVFYAVFGAKSRWLYPVAILLHALIDIPAAAMQAGLIQNFAIVEVLIGLSCVAVIAIAYFVHRRWRAGSELSSGGEVA